MVRTKKINTSISAETVFFLFTLILGAFLRLRSLGARDLWFDEIVTVEVSRKSVWYILEYHFYHVVAPLDNLILHFIMAIFGYSEFVIRIKSNGSNSVGINTFKNQSGTNLRVYWPSSVPNVSISTDKYDFYRFRTFSRSGAIDVFSFVDGQNMGYQY